MTRLKHFDRFPHTGVRKDLDRMRKALLPDSRLTIGSSGEGEMTIKGAERTIYARKYKKKDGWRVVVCRGSRVIAEDYPDSFDAARALIARNLIWPRTE